MSLEDASVLNKSLLSAKQIQPNERLIVALDVSTLDEAKKVVEQLGDAVSFYKVGLEIVMGGFHLPLIQWLRKEKDKKVFVDIKIFDVPETAKKAFLQCKHLDVSFVTVHMMEDIVKAVVEQKDGTKILAVTVLTSWDKKEMAELGFNCDVETLVLKRARRALDLGCDGVISSGLEAPKLRESFGERFIIITPGIRDFSNLASNVAAKDDQKRIVTVEEAFLKGADYIVMGRPILKHQDPKAKAEEIQQIIARVFKK